MNTSERNKNKMVWGFPTNFLLQVQMGEVAGFSYLYKFGENPEVTTATDPEDIWEAGGVYPFSATADIVSLSSDDDGDTQDITVHGLDADGYSVIQTLTLTGQTRVALTTALWRVYRLQNVGSVDLAGNVYCYSGITNDAGVPDSGSVEKARITNGHNQTLMAIYTIPKGKVGFLVRGEGGLNYEGTPITTTEMARLSYQARQYGKVFRVLKMLSVLTSGDSNYADIRQAPDPIPALTDVKITANEVSTTLGVWATFEILLVDENKLKAGFLTAIGQPT